MRTVWIFLLVAAMSCGDDEKTVIYLLNDDQVGPGDLNIDLDQNFPNPFNPSTSIGYEVSEEISVRLAVWTSDWQEVETLVNGVKAPGVYRVAFAALNIASGEYYYTLETNDIVIVRRMKLIK